VNMWSGWVQSQSLVKQQTCLPIRVLNITFNLNQLFLNNKLIRRTWTNCLTPLLTPHACGNPYYTILHGLVFVGLYRRFVFGTLYWKLCFFPNHVQLIELATGGFQSSCRDISRMIKGNWMHLSSIWSVIAKGLNTFWRKRFLAIHF